MTCIAYSMPYEWVKHFSIFLENKKHSGFIIIIEITEILKHNNAAADDFYFDELTSGEVRFDALFLRAQFW